MNRSVWVGRRRSLACLIGLHARAEPFEREPYDALCCPRCGAELDVLLDDEERAPDA